MMTPLPAGGESRWVLGGAGDGSNVGVAVGGIGVSAGGIGVAVAGKGPVYDHAKVMEAPPVSW